MVYVIRFGAAQIWREGLSKRTGLDHTSAVAPQGPVTILVRTDGSTKRRITNLPELVAAVKADYSADVTVVTLNYTSRFADYVAAFAGRSLIISSHSSQVSLCQAPLHRPRN
jgi:hypothetical protein